jgi:ribonuclease HI
MTVIAHTDGASRGNPGESGIGAVLETENGTVLATIAGFIGTTTNNVAEYTALLECVKAANGLPCRKLIVHSDSELMVRQLNGQYKVRATRLKKIADEVRVLVKSATFEFEIRHVLRGANADADELAKGGIDSRTSVQVHWSDHARGLMNVK